MICGYDLRSQPGRTAICSAACRSQRRRETYRTKNYRRRTNMVESNVTPEYERELRRTAVCCTMPGCGVQMTDEPFLPNSKELDHMLPINVGGKHTVENVRIICRSCNARRPRDGSDLLVA